MGDAKTDKNKEIITKKTKDQFDVTDILKNNTRFMIHGFLSIYSELSLKQLSELSNKPKNSLLDHLNIMVGGGIIEISREVRVRGKNTRKYYQLASDADEKTRYLLKKKDKKNTSEYLSSSIETLIAFSQTKISMLSKWVQYLEPTIFIMENVKGILSRHNADGDKVIEVIRKTFSDIGYSNINIWALNAAEYGVPQLRERVFIVGHKKNITIDAPLKTHYINKKVKGLKKAITTKEAISDLPKINASEGQEVQKYKKKPKSKYQISIRGNQKVLYNHAAMKHTKRIIERFDHINIGESVSHVSIKYKERKRNGNGEISKQSYNMNNRRLDPDKPSYTIPASFYSSFVHPYLNRNLTAREAARIQSFPDNYRFMGKRTLVSSKLSKKNGNSYYNYLSQYNQIGNAVPPILSKTIANHIYSFL